MNYPKYLTETTESGSLDRLGVLLRSFTLQVQQIALDQATLVVLADKNGKPTTVQLRRKPGISIRKPTISVFSAVVSWGGGLNPLLAALPDIVSIDLTQDRESDMLVSLLCTEFFASRCGASSAVNRLAEVLIIRLMRCQIEQGAATPGLLAGLADARLSRAIVAIHEHPGRDLRNDDLASVAGLSPSHFAERFRTRVGEPPAAYLRRWRLSCAFQDLQAGARVAAVAHRYGYASPEAFARAYQKQHGVKPTTTRSVDAR